MQGANRPVGSRPYLKLWVGCGLLTVLFPLPSSAAPQDQLEGRLAAANQALERGDTTQADALSEAALAFAPTNVKALLLRAQILVMKGNLSQAEDLLIRACKVAPDSPDAYFQLGVFYDSRQESLRAVEQFERVIRLSPENPRAYDYLALNLEPLGQFERAEWSYRKGLAVNRGALFDSFLDYNYGRFLMKMNRLDEALKHLNRAAELTPNVRAVYYERAKLNERLGHHGQARLDAEMALQLKDPAGVILDLQVYYLLARIYSRLGEKQLANQYTKLAQSSTVPVKSRARGGR